MYRMLVVDDDATEREVIRFLLNKNDFPLRVQEAANGKIAWEILQKKEFDILFTDIRMPFSDGLELAKRSKTQYPEMQIVFFSGYDDFNYVKEALSLQVVNYILKPVNPSEFAKTISDVIKLLQERDTLTEKERLTEEFTRTHILYKLINKSSVQRLSALYPHVDFSFLDTYQRLLLLQFECDFSGQAVAGTEGDFRAIKHFLPEDCAFVNLNPLQSLVLFSKQGRSADWYQKFAVRFSEQIQSNFDVRCFVAISEPLLGPENLSAAYEQAELWLAQRFFFAEDTSTAPPPTESNMLSSVQNTQNLLQTAILTRDAEGLAKSMGALLQSLRVDKRGSHIYVRYICTNVFKMMWDELAGIAEGTFEEYAGAIYSYSHFTEIEDILQSLAHQLAKIFAEDQNSPKYVIQLVKQFIHNHYDEDLSLDILSQQIHLTPRYLSELFIKETGYGINKYIREVRMNKACELLLTTNLKINEISQRVGYTNLSYFSKSFADDFGSTPSNFRENRG